MVDQLVMVDQATGTPEPRASIYLYLSIYLSIYLSLALADGRF